jgi:hypothetical protein
MSARQPVGDARFTPAASSNRYAAAPAKWFGVAEAQWPTMAASIGDFEGKDLGFLL